MAYKAPQRKKAVQLRKKGLRCKAIAAEVGFNSAKAASAVVSRFSKSKKYTDAPRRKGRCKLNNKQLAILKHIIVTHPTASLREKRDLFNNRPNIKAAGITISHSTVARLTKRWCDRAAPPSPWQQQSINYKAARIAFCKNRLRIGNIISLDSCEIDTRDLVDDLNAKPQTVRKGTVPQAFPVPPVNASPQVHLYASLAGGDQALSNVTFVPYKRKQQYVYAGLCRPADRDKQEAFASKHLAPVLKEVCRHAEANNMKQGEWQLLLGGASQHTSSEAKQMLRAASIRIVKDFPAHSPDLNPIERVWHLLREQLRKLIAKGGVPATNAKLEELVLKAWGQISRATAKKYMKALPGRMKWVRDNGGRFPAP